MRPLAHFAFVVEERIRELALPGTRYARPCATAASVRAIVAEDVRKFLRSTFRPERAVVVVTGPGAAAETVERVAATFGARSCRQTPGSGFQRSSRASRPSGSSPPRDERGSMRTRSSSSATLRASSLRSAKSGSFRR
jgi:hypothetical protein